MTHAQLDYCNVYIVIGITLFEGNLKKGTVEETFLRKGIFGRDIMRKGILRGVF